VAGLPWVEIDFPVDLARARRSVWPEIRGDRYRKRRRRRVAAIALMAGLVIATAAALPYFTRPDPPPPTEWVTMVFDGLEQDRVTIGERSQSWWLLESGTTARIVVNGPGPVRIESRLLDRPGENEPYVLEVSLDGERLDWFKLTTRPSGRATHPTHAISHKERLTLDLPGERHELEVRMIAPRDADCFIRVRQPDIDTEDISP
jgi:hypothetical protein